MEDDAKKKLPTGPLCDGLVLSIRGQISVVYSEGFTLPCEVRRKFRTGRRSLAVGDQVRFLRHEDVTDGVEGVVEELLPRRSKLSRMGAGQLRREQVIVANVDLVLITVCLGLPKLNLGFIDRVHTAALIGKLDAVICLNKVDLLGDADREMAEKLPLIYEPLGVPVVLTSAVKATGIEALKQHLYGKITVLSGPSGAGKSTLLNCLEPGLKLRTSEISKKWGKGRHATTWSSLLQLSFGAFVVDTPGMREFGLFQVPYRELAGYFPDLAGHQCRFSDCLHKQEPDCSVLEALRSGEIAPSRYQSYRRILEQLEQEAREW